MLTQKEFEDLVESVKFDAKTCGYVLREKAIFKMSTSMTRAFGLYHREDILDREGQLQYSEHVITVCSYQSRHSMENTLMHELLHAIVGSYYGHGPRWQKAAKAVNQRLGYSISAKSSPGESAALLETLSQHGITPGRKKKMK